MWSVHRMEYYSAMKRKEVLIQWITSSQVEKVSTKSRMLCDSIYMTCPE